jgi:hypothetical protein
MALWTRFYGNRVTWPQQYLERKNNGLLRGGVLSLVRAEVISEPYQYGRQPGGEKEYSTVALRVVGGDE